MFDIGFWEILLIGVLALVVIGPERLPAAARQAGYFVGKARRYIEGVKSEVSSELDIDEFKRVLHNQEVQINELQQQLKSGIADVKSELPTADFLTESSTHSKENEVDSESTTHANKSNTKPVSTESDTPAQPEDLNISQNKKANNH